MQPQGPLLIYFFKFKLVADPLVCKSHYRHR